MIQLWHKSWCTWHKMTSLVQRLQKHMPTSAPEPRPSTTAARKVLSGALREDRRGVLAEEGEGEEECLLVEEGSEKGVEEGSEAGREAGGDLDEWYWWRDEEGERGMWVAEEEVETRGM